MKRKNLLPLLLLIAAIATLTWYYKSYKTAPSLPAYNTRVLDSGGNTLELKNLRGSYVLISYFQTWCGDCVREIPSIEHLQATAGKERLKVLLVTDEDESKIEFFKQRFNVTADIYYSEKPLKEQLRVFPTTYLLNKKGEVIMSKLEGYEWDSPEVLNLIEN